jgi:hypothetical protein
MFVNIPAPLYRIDMFRFVFVRSSEASIGSCAQITSMENIFDR